LQLSADWLDHAKNASPEERATVADVRIFVDRQNVTLHLFGDSVFDYVVVALYGVAHGIAHDWWKIFGSRDNEFSLLRYRSGFVLPDIRVRFDGAAFEITAVQRNYPNPGARFWGGFSEIMSREDGEAILTDIVERVLSRLEKAGLEDNSAILRWTRVKRSRGSEEAIFCEAAGGLGVDPYEIDEAGAEFIERAEKYFERETLVEFASGASAVNKARLMEWVERMLRHRGFQYRVANLEAAVRQVAEDSLPKSSQKNWAIGYRRARALRSILGVAQNERFSSFQKLAAKLGASRSYNVAPEVDGIRALRSKRADGIQIHLRNHGDSAESKSAHLFAMARAVGDAACFPDTQLSPVNDLHNAVRQAAGRAFAAEFLAPIDEIKSMREDKHDLVTIANEFAVSTTVIERQLENEDRIRAACA
jgi:SOS response regulatory protein OraA/RecX